MSFGALLASKHMPVLISLDVSGCVYVCPSACVFLSVCVCVRLSSLCYLFLKSKLSHLFSIGDYNSRAGLVIKE